MIQPKAKGMRLSQCVRVFEGILQRKIHSRKMLFLKIVRIASCEIIFELGLKGLFRLV